MSQSQKIQLKLSPQAARYARPDAPVPARLMAAGGALPLPPIELATVVFALLHDPEVEVKERARKTLEELPEGVLHAVLAGPAHPALLSTLAHIHHQNPQRTELLALNPDIDDATLIFLASLPHKRVVDIVANNQQRILRCPEIVDALGDNRLTGRAAIDRILSFLGLSKPESEVVDFDILRTTA